MQLLEMVELYLLDVCAGKANETPTAYRRKLAQLLQFIGADRETISPPELERFRRHLLTRTTKMRGHQRVDGQLSPYTVKSIVVTVRQFLRWACAHGCLPDL